MGWHSRGYLPHFDGKEITQAIIFHLADSLPRKIVEKWKEELSNLPPEESDVQRRCRLESYLDKGYGSAWLKDPRIARLAEETILLFDGQRYYLHAWVIMPNHIHVLITPQKNWRLSTIIQTWKSYTAKQANSILGRTGKFWQEEYFDRFIRDQRHFIAALRYIEANPVKAGLCRNKEEWIFGSAARRI